MPAHVHTHKCTHTCTRACMHTYSHTPQRAHTQRLTLAAGWATATVSSWKLSPASPQLREALFSVTDGVVCTGCSSGPFGKKPIKNHFNNTILHQWNQIIGCQVISPQKVECTFDSNAVFSMALLLFHKLISSVNCGSMKVTWLLDDSAGSLPALDLSPER